MKKGRGAFSRAISAVDLEPDLESYLPIIEIAGNTRLHIENYKSIQCFSENAVHICLEFGKILIIGRSLLISKASNDSVSIEGIIEEIQFDSRR